MMKIAFAVQRLPAGTLTARQLSAIATSLAAELKAFHVKGTIGLAFISRPAMQDLNHTFRGKNKPTNVLSFPQHAPAALKTRRADRLYLGDIALCLPVIRAEAGEKKIPLKHHLMHLVVHGSLHLLGFDHEHDSDAEKMERREIAILGRHAVPNPYRAPPSAPSRKPRAPARTIK